MENSKGSINNNNKLHILMFPWFAYGHMTPFLHLSNKLSQKGHKISFLVPKSAQPKLEKLNQNPTLIHFFTLNLPLVEGLPPGAETASDIPLSLSTPLATAFDLTRPQVESILTLTRPDFIFFDFGFWVPSLANELNIKSVYFAVVGAASHAGALVPSKNLKPNWTPDELVQLPPGCPFPKVCLKPHEARIAVMGPMECGDGITLFERLMKSMRECDVIAMRTCREIEGPYCHYVAQQYNKDVLLTGHILPETELNPQNLADTWATWLGKYKSKSIVYCALGSQISLEIAQFQEILLGFELTNLPFLLALQPPRGSASVEDAMPAGFKERTQDRGVVYGGWVPQTGILAHENVGCFVSHCGFGSMWESLLSECQIVLVPHLPDQVINCRLMVEELGVAVEVETEESNGWISKDNLCQAMRSVMDEDSELGSQLKKNHAIWKQRVSGEKLQEDYIDNFIKDLQKMLD